MVCYVARNNFQNNELEIPIKNTVIKTVNNSKYLLLSRAGCMITINIYYFHAR